MLLLLLLLEVGLVAVLLLEVGLMRLLGVGLVLVLLLEVGFVMPLLCVEVGTLAGTCVSPTVEEVVYKNTQNQYYTYITCTVATLFWPLFCHQRPEKGQRTTLLHG